MSKPDCTLKNAQKTRDYLPVLDNFAKKAVNFKFFVITTALCAFSDKGAFLVLTTQVCL